MKKTLLTFISCLLALALLGASKMPRQNTGSIKALLIAPNYYGANTMLLLDDCEEYGVEVTLTGLTRQVAPCPWAAGRKLPALKIDSLISEISDIKNYDCLILTNASWRYTDVFADVMNDSLSMQLIKKASDNGLVIYLPCGAPRVLAKAGRLNGRIITGVAQYKSEYLEAGATYKGENIMPVTDSNLVSATRGMYYHTENFDALIAAIQKHRLEQNKGGRK